MRRMWAALSSKWARKALSAIYHTGQRFGAMHLIEVLRGKTGERASRWGHDKLNVFGVGADATGMRQVCGRRGRIRIRVRGARS